MLALSLFHSDEARFSRHISDAFYLRRLSQFCYSHGGPISLVNDVCLIKGRFQFQVSRVKKDMT